jgi:hypothetical protein
MYERFAQLFAGRTDTYGSWSGGCVHETVHISHFVNHLMWGPHIGVYPLMDGDVVNWGCVDIDFDDIGLALTLRAALNYKDVPAHVERTNKGWHVWVFAANACPAHVMRRALMAACKAIGYNPKEVNPKQEHLEPGKVGNYVRLPYPGGTVGAPETRYMVTDDGAPIHLERFLDGAHTVAVATLEPIARLWTPPTTTTFEVRNDQNVEALVQVLGSLSYTIWRDGPLPGSDRSSTLTHLAHLMCEEGFTPTAAFTILASADQRWGKFADRPDRDEQLSRIIERAYAQ